MENRVKLVYTAFGGQSLLFDLARDPMERRDLSADPAYAKVQERLRRKLLAHAAQYQPEALENGAFRTWPAPSFPGDHPDRWYGFHYHDYSVDTFH